MDLQDDIVNNPTSVERLSEQAVIICLQFPAGKFQQASAVNALFDLDDIFAKIIESSGLGMYDGNEISEGASDECVTFFFYGPDANRIYHEIEPILDSLPDLPGSYIIKRYSSFDNGEERVVL